MQLDAPAVSELPNLSCISIALGKAAAIAEGEAADASPLPLGCCSGWTPRPGSRDAGAGWEVIKGGWRQEPPGVPRLLPSWPQSTADTWPWFCSPVQ